VSSNPFDDREAAFATPPPKPIPAPDPQRPQTQDQVFRAAHIGGSEASALVGLSPYDSPWSLYMKKAGKLPHPDLSNSGTRQRWGMNLERAIISDTAEQLGKDIRKWMRGPLSDGVLGGHPDARQVVNGATRAIVETKAMDWLVFRDFGQQPPDHHVIQLNTYCGLAGVDRGYLSILVGGNDLKIFEYEFRPRLFEICRTKALELWQRVRDNNPPPVDYEVDQEAIAEIFRAGGGKAIVDLTGDNELADAIQTYIEQSAIEKAAKAAKAAAKAEIQHKTGEADGVICGDWQVTFSLTAGIADEEITAENCKEFIGRTIKGRARSRSINTPKFIGRKQ
jgi:predicted phage-related endonuclease